MIPNFIIFSISVPLYVPQRSLGGHNVLGADLIWVGASVMLSYTQGILRISWHIRTKFAWI